MSTADQDLAVCRGQEADAGVAASAGTAAEDDGDESHGNGGLLGLLGLAGLIPLFMARREQRTTTTVGRH